MHGYLCGTYVCECLCVHVYIPAYHSRYVTQVCVHEYQGMLDYFYGVLAVSDPLLDVVHRTCYLLLAHFSFAT